MEPRHVMRMDDRFYTGTLEESGLWHEVVFKGRTLPDKITAAIAVIDAAVCSPSGYLLRAEGVGMRYLFEAEWYYYLPEQWYEGLEDEIYAEIINET